MIVTVSVRKESGPDEHSISHSAIVKADTVDGVRHATAQALSLVTETALTKEWIK